jgi:hypothetical protein
MKELMESVAAPVPSDARMLRYTPAPRDQKRAPVPARERKAVHPAVPKAPEPRPIPLPPPSQPSVSLPPPQTKSPEDLKAILRTMTAKTSAERTQANVSKQQSLKGALAQVLAKDPQKTPITEPEAPLEKKPFEVSEQTLRDVLKGTA